MHTAKADAMPDWLTPHLILFNQQIPTTAQDWNTHVHTQLHRLNRQAPLSLLHGWQAKVVAPLLIETSTRRNGNPDLHRAAQALHLEALAGNTASAETWTATLEPALREIYRYAYAYADAYSVAHATAHSYAMANDYGEDGAAEFAESYAKLNTGANARSFADANAIANAHAMATAFATGDAQAYAETWPAAWLQACALAHAGDDGAALSAERLQASYQRLADGLLVVLAELPTPP